MATKMDSTKLSPAERLARKRAAARLRQQRCRARKRQAMLEKKRGEIFPQRCIKLNQDPSASAVGSIIPHRHQSLLPSYNECMPSEETPDASWSRVRRKGASRTALPSSEPIYNCVSFDSQKSSEEVQHNISRVSSSPPRSPSQKSLIVVTPSRTPPPGKQNTAVRALSNENIEDSLVSEEEAAVVAMLSLKSGSTNPSEKCEHESNRPLHSLPRDVMISHKPTSYVSSDLGTMHSEQITHIQQKSNHSIQSQQQRRFVPRLYEAYNYVQPMKIPPHSRRAQVPPGYYRMYSRMPPPHPLYSRCYYHTGPRYVSHEY